MNSEDLRRWLPRFHIGRAGKHYKRLIKPRRWADGSVKARVVLFGRTFSVVRQAPA